MAIIQIDGELFVFNHFAPKKSLHFVMYSISMVEHILFSNFYTVRKYFFNYQLKNAQKIKFIPL